MVSNRTLLEDNHKKAAECHLRLKKDEATPKDMGSNSVWIMTSASIKLRRILWRRKGCQNSTSTTSLASRATTQTATLLRLPTWRHLHTTRATSRCSRQKRPTSAFWTGGNQIFRVSTKWISPFAPNRSWRMSRRSKRLASWTPQPTRTWSCSRILARDSKKTCNQKCSNTFRTWSEK